MNKTHCEWRVSSPYGFGVMVECGRDAVVINRRNNRRYCEAHGKRLKNPKPILSAAEEAERRIDQRKSLINDVSSFFKTGGL